MLSILSLYLRIIQLKAGPEDVPASGLLLLIITAANVLTSLALSLTLGTASMGAVTTTILSNLAVQAFIIYGLLALMGKSNRLTQTLSAFFGCDLLLNALVGLGIGTMHLFEYDVLTPLALAIVLWSTVVYGFIFHRALEVHIAVGIGLAFVLTLLAVSTGQLAAGNG